MVNLQLISLLYHSCLLDPDPGGTKCNKFYQAECLFTVIEISSPLTTWTINKCNPITLYFSEMLKKMTLYMIKIVLKLHNQTRKRNCFSQSLSTGNGGTTVQQWLYTDK